MGWENNIFPDADDPDDVGWLISYWRTVPCESCEKDYRLESRQFDHLVKAATKPEALAKFKEYINQKKLSGKQGSIKNLTLFLSKVEDVSCISGTDGEII